MFNEKQDRTLSNSALDNVRPLLWAPKDYSKFQQKVSILLR